MLTPRVLPTCLISPTRPMIVNSAIVFMASFLFPSPRAFGSCRRSLGCGSEEVGRAGPAPARHTSGPERQRRTAEGGDFGAGGIRPSGRRGKSSNGAVAARLVRLHGRHENPRDRTGHVRNPSIPVSCSLLACPLLHFFRLFCVNVSFRE